MFEGGETPADGRPGRPGGRGASPRLTWPETLLLLVLAAVQFTHIVDFSIVMPLGPLLEAGPERHGLGLSLSQFDSIVAVYGVSAAVAGLLAALIMDRFDRKRLLTFFYTGFCVGTGLCAVAPNYWTLLVARMVAGAFGGVGASATLVIVGDVFHDSRRGTAMGVLMTAFSVASIIGVPAGLVVADQFAVWQAPFAALAGMGAAVLVLMQVVLPPLPRPAGDHPAGMLSILSRYLKVLLRPGHLLAFSFMTALVFGSFTIWPPAPLYLTNNVGMREDYLKYVYVCGGIATMPLLSWIGKLSDRFGKRLMFRVLATITIIPLLLMTNLPAGLSLPWVLAATTFLMTATSGRMVPAMALITAASEPAERGSFLSINSAVQQTALALAAMLGGAMMGQTDAGALTGYTNVGIFSACVTLGTVFMVGIVRTAPGGEAAVTAVAPPAPEAAIVEEAPEPCVSPEAVRASAD